MTEVQPPPKKLHLNPIKRQWKRKKNSFRLIIHHSHKSLNLGIENSLPTQNHLAQEAKLLGYIVLCTILQYV
jgi:transposase